MRRIGFRRLLPVVNVLIYTALIWRGYLQVSRHSWAFYHEGEFPAVHRYAFAINLPAQLAARVLLPRWFSAPDIECLLIGLWGVLLWFRLGTWLDRRLGFLPPCKFRTGFAAKTARLGIAIICVVIAGGLFSGLIYAVLTYDIMSDAFFTSIMTALGLFWAAVLPYVTVSNIIRARRQELLARNS